MKPPFASEHARSRATQQRLFDWMKCVVMARTSQIPESLSRQCFAT